MKLTYKVQITLSVITIILANILTDVLDHWLYRSLGFAVCGLLFIIHPVVPKWININRQTLLWTRIGGIILILIGMFTRVNLK